MDLATPSVEAPAMRAACGSTDGLWDWCVTTRQFWCSPQLERMLEGLASPAPIGGSPTGGCEIDWQAVQSTIHPADAPDLLADIRRCGEQGATLDHQFRMRAIGSEHRWYRIHGVQTRLSDGRVFVSGGLRDIHDYRLAADSLRDKEQQLVQRKRMDAIDCLAGGIAHEFNNVLQAVRGYISFATKELPADSQPSQDLAQAMLASDRAVKLTRELLGFARAEADPEQEESAAVDVDEAIDGLLNLVRPVIGADIELRVARCARPLVTIADSVELRQALLNLCLNARDAMQQGGTLSISTSSFEVDDAMAEAFIALAPGSYCRILVTDSGCGIEGANCARVFDPFYTTKEVGRGTGLGLAAVHGFAQRSGGHATVYSEGKDRGSTFALYLPLREKNGGWDESPRPEMSDHE